MRHGQCQPLTTVPKIAAEITHHKRGVKVWVIDQQLPAVFCDDDVAARRDESVRCKGEVDAINETPAAKVHRARAFVVQFDELVILITGDRMVHDLIDYNV